MTLVNPIQEGGCTTPSRMPVHKLPNEDGLPVLAVLSPAGVVALLCGAARIFGPGVESISLLFRVGVAAVGLAVGLSITALWRARKREARILSSIGLVGNGLLLAAGIVYAALR